MMNLLRTFFLFSFVSFAVWQCHPPSPYISCEDVKTPADMSCIPGGFFTRGSNRASINEDTRVVTHDESPEQQIELSTFLIDRYEVTYSDYKKCEAAGGCTHANPNYRGYSRDNQPILGVNWYQARDYCAWRGKKLPTEAEWEKAARGPSGELYPWGNEPADCSRAVIDAVSPLTNVSPAGPNKGCGTGVTADVGSRKPGRYGLYDMAGNSWEWVFDWYSESYAACGAACSQKDPQGPCAGKDTCKSTVDKVVRGGSWWWPGESALGSNRRPHVANNKPYHHFGFRCAKSVPVTDSRR